MEFIRKTLIKICIFTVINFSLIAAEVRHNECQGMSEEGKFSFYCDGSSRAINTITGMSYAAISQSKFLKNIIDDVGMKGGAICLPSYLFNDLALEIVRDLLFVYDESLNYENDLECLFEVAVRSAVFRDIVRALYYLECDFLIQVCERVYGEYLTSIYLSRFNSAADLINNAALVELFEQYRDSEIHNKDDNIKLSDKQYELINESFGTECSICLLKNDKINQSTSEMIKVNCPSKHTFCKACIEENYKYQQTCPNCRGQISERN